MDLEFMTGATDISIRAISSRIREVEKVSFSINKTLFMMASGLMASAAKGRNTSVQRMALINISTVPPKTFRTNPQLRDYQWRERERKLRGRKEETRKNTWLASSRPRKELAAGVAPATATSKAKASQKDTPAIKNDSNVFMFSCK